MSEKPEKPGRDEGAGEPRRPHAALLIGGLLVMLAIGIAAGYLLGTSPGADEPDGGQDAASVEPASQESSQAARPVAVVPDGDALAPLSGPPEGTMAMLETSTVAADATYQITFRPYGYGPGQPGSSVVVRLEKATPQNASAERFDMSGRNVLATVIGGGTEIAEGGVYTGILAFRPQGHLLSPVLRDVRSAD